MLPRWQKKFRPGSIRDSGHAGTFFPATRVSRAEVASRVPYNVGGGFDAGGVVMGSQTTCGVIFGREIRRESEIIVEMTEFRIAAPSAQASTAFRMESKLLWEQETPILDVALFPDSMLVLDTAGLARYERHAGKWDRAAAIEIPLTVRDPRGRLEINGT
jgi:hypothetical protein